MLTPTRQEIKVLKANYEHFLFSPQGQRQEAKVRIMAFFHMYHEYLFKIMLENVELFEVTEPHRHLTMEEVEKTILRKRRLFRGF